MRLDWMGEYRELLEKLIRYCNVYAAVYKKEQMTELGIPFTLSEIQVLEYLLENEERNENLSVIALRLGIALSSFSKLVTALEKKGLLEKYYLEGNKKNIVIRVSALGRQLYDSYACHILEHHFSPMFEVLKEIPPEYLERFGDALANPLQQCCPICEKKEASPALIPCKKQE